VSNLPKCRLKRQSLSHIFRDLNSEKGVAADTDIEPLTPDMWIPRQHTPTIRAFQELRTKQEILTNRKPIHWTRSISAIHYIHGSRPTLIDPLKWQSKTLEAGCTLATLMGPPFTLATPVGKQSSN